MTILWNLFLLFVSISLSLCVHLSLKSDGNVWPQDGLQQTRVSRVLPESRHGNVSLIPLRGSENEMRNSVAAFSQDLLAVSQPTNQWDKSRTSLAAQFQANQRHSCWTGGPDPQLWCSPKSRTNLHSFCICWKICNFGGLISVQKVFQTYNGAWDLSSKMFFSYKRRKIVGACACVGSMVSFSRFIFD